MIQATQYWAIVEHDHAIQNPTSPEKLALLADYCRLRAGLELIDVGCGKGWLLCDWASRAAIRGTGLEINPWFSAAARQRAQTAGAHVARRLNFVEGPANAFRPDPTGYDIALCIGASFALGGLAPTLTWLRAALRPGGVIAVGEPFLRQRPLPAPVAAIADPELAALPDLAGMVAVVRNHGLELTGLIVASEDDWDRYESLHWRATHAWARANPAHPHRAELLARSANDRSAYLAWQRQYLGWAIVVARPVDDHGA